MEISTSTIERERQTERDRERERQRERERERERFIQTKAMNEVDAGCDREEEEMRQAAVRTVKVKGPGPCHGPRDSHFSIVQH